MKQNQDYLTYKKSKMEAEGNKLSKKRVVLYACLLSFASCFALVMYVISHYGAKMDIEYGRTVQSQDKVAKNIDTPYVKTSILPNFKDERKHPIDNRLRLLQAEEIAPSEAKIIGKNKEKPALDLDQYQKLIEEHADLYEKSKHAEIPSTNLNLNENSGKTTTIVGDTPTITTAPAPAPAPQPQPQSTRSYSKVLIGKYENFDEAKAMQSRLKESDGTMTFIRKMGNIYSLQVGSYSDESTAENIANKYSENYQVWIIQD